MSLTVLSVAFPLAPVGPDAVGGAEQILSHLDTALTASGHRSLVVACEGSRVAGTLIPTPAISGVITDEAKADVQVAHCRNIAETLRRERVDLIHMHGIDFDAYLPPGDVPHLVTLHLPAAWYQWHIWDLPRPNTFLHTVSDAQRAWCPPHASLLPTIPNGVPVDELDKFRHTRQNFALTLGRICPEKNFHTALDAGKQAGVPVLLGGEVFNYDAHRDYFEQEIVPRLDGCRRFLGPVGFARKRRLLSSAHCLLSASLAQETSSLVAMEALACGTPVVAFPSGALPDIVEHGKTGFLISSMEEMADAIRAVDSLDREACRQVARERFSLDAMTARYFEVYQKLASTARPTH